MMLELFFCLFLDYRHLTLPDEAMVNTFAVSQWENESTPNCTLNPMNGHRMNGDLLSVDGSPLPEYVLQNTPFPISVTENETGVTPMVFVPPGGNPTPPMINPPMPPVPTTPEPSTIVIFSVVAVMLLWLLFRKRRRRPCYPGSSN